MAAGGRTVRVLISSTHRDLDATVPLSAELTDQYRDPVGSDAQRKLTALRSHLREAELPAFDCRGIRRRIHGPREESGE